MICKRKKKANRRKEISQNPKRYKKPSDMKNMQDDKFQEIQKQENVPSKF